MLSSRYAFGAAVAADDWQMHEFIYGAEQCEKRRKRSENNSQDNIWDYLLFEICYGLVSGFIWKINASNRAGIIDYLCEPDAGVTTVGKQESLIESLFNVGLVGQDNI